ncbi:unnamed protein product [Lactuca virosa]|uniref:Uncharacterized protein n=1 Tax=Lactuca virosa TaxID=75947 RepID=A0AAU9LRS3_9ASTR|nr:unnamed protein product [Lactuca virosa]
MMNLYGVGMINLYDKPICSRYDKPVWNRYDKPIWNRGAGRWRSSASSSSSGSIGSKHKKWNDWGFSDGARRIKGRGCEDRLKEIASLLSGEPFSFPAARHRQQSVRRATTSSVAVNGGSTVSICGRKGRGWWVRVVLHLPEGRRGSDGHSGSSFVISSSPVKDRGK